MQFLPYEVKCNGAVIGYVANMQLAKVLAVALMDNVSDIQSLSIQQVIPPINPAENKVLENE